MSIVLEIPLSCKASAQAIEQLVRVVTRSVSAFSKTSEPVSFMDDIEAPVAEAVAA